MHKTLPVWRREMHKTLPVWHREMHNPLRALSYFCREMHMTLPGSESVAFYYFIGSTLLLYLCTLLFSFPLYCFVCALYYSPWHFTTLFEHFTTLLCTLLFLLALYYFICALYYAFRHFTTLFVHFTTLFVHFTILFMHFTTFTGSVSTCNVPDSILTPRFSNPQRGTKTREF